MKHYLGMDVGGTKTYCLIGDETGRVLAFGKAGSGNYESHGIEPASQQNRSAVDEALAEASLTLDAISGVGLGVAGADLPEDFEMLEREIYRPLFGEIPRHFRNDSIAGLRGGTRDPYGVVIVCGTGSVCAGKNGEGEETRVGGLGEEFGDRCTGAGIGEEGLRAVWRARDGIIESTLLSAKFVARAGCVDLEELFYKVYRGEISRAGLEPMAKLVFEAAFDGDATACAILRDGGRYLGAMVNTVARKLHLVGTAHDVVMAGSVFKGVSPVLVDEMRLAIRAVSADARLVLPEFEPVVGALLMALELDSPATSEIYEQLSRDLVKLEDRYSVKLKAGSS